jgi:O-antigen ligase
MTPLRSTAYPQAVIPVGGLTHGRPPAAAPKYQLGFLLFVLVNAALFMRPTEIFPEYFWAQTYLYLILACLAVSFPSVWKQVAAGPRFAEPTTVCVLGLLAAVVLSHATHFAVDAAYSSGWEFAKIVLYYFLFLGLVNTPARLRQLLFCLIVFVSAQAAVALLQYYGTINNPAFESIYEEQRVDVFKGAEYLRRLCGSGIFHNPNELCYPLVVAMMICLYFVSGKRWHFLVRLLCLAALGLFGYALTLTHSRGGFLGLLLALLSLLISRFGWRKAVPFAVLVLPVLFLLFGGRQTDLSVDKGTGQTRVQLWSDGLVLFTGAPIFGIGTGNYASAAGLVAHNTFVQNFAELGFFGGTLFVGAFYCAFSALRRLSLHQGQILDPELRRLLPYLVAVVAGYMGCMLSMSLHNMVPTYTILGLATVYVRIAATWPPVPMARFDAGLVLRMIALSAATVVAFHFYVRSTMIVG